MTKNDVLKFYTFLLACINKTWDEEVAAKWPLFYLRDVVMSNYWIFAKGGKI